MKTIKVLTVFLWASASLFYFSSCKYDQVNVKYDTFIKTYATDSWASAAYLEQLPDMGFISVSCQGNGGKAVIIRTDKNGNLIWKKLTEKYIISPSNYWNVFSHGDPGTFVAQTGGNFSIFDSLGNTQNSMDVLTKYFTAFSPMVSMGSNLLVSSCDGMYTSSPSANYIYVFNQGLQPLSRDSFLDSKLGGKTLLFAANGKSPKSSYIIGGKKYTATAWNWTDKTKLFVAQVSKSGSKMKQTIIDENDERYSDDFTGLIGTNDSGIVLFGTRIDFSKKFKYPIVLRFDKNLNLVWKKEFSKENQLITLVTISECPDGGFLLNGSSSKLGYQTSPPYVIKIDKGGNQQWDKTINSDGIGYLNFGIPLAAGGYGFVGCSNNFGSGLGGYRILFVKTDVNGNYH